MTDDPRTSHSTTSNPEMSLDSPQAKPLLRVDGMSKSFGNTHALRGVGIDFHAGSVHGVIGENGAGKSTLMSIVAGIYTPTAGTIELDGQPVTLASPRDAMRLGIAMIHQELNLIDSLSVADNLYLGREPGRGGVLDLGAMRRSAAGELRRVGASFTPEARVGDLSLAQRQLVEIAKALSQNARIVIMDEPTAVLTPLESDALLGVVRELRDRGVLVILISHRLQELLRACDRITVLRDGALVTTLAAAQTSERALADLMVGRALGEQFPSIARPRPVDLQGSPALELDRVGLPGVLENISFRVGTGEVFGLGGLVGAGRTELGEALVGIRRGRTGVVRTFGNTLDRRATVADATKAGIAYLSEDRKGRALLVDLGVVENTTLVSLSRYCQPFVQRKAEESATASHVARLGIKAASLRIKVSSLSGGNQQKVAIAKWLEVSPQVLILDEPTRGVDVGAKREIYNVIKLLAEAGKAVIVISSELPELLGLCHRIGVMRRGHLAGILTASEASEQSVMYLATGAGPSPTPTPSTPPHPHAL